MDKQEENINKDFMPKAQVEIMLEGIRGDFKVFGEKLEMIDGRLMNVENKVEQIDTRLIRVEDRLVNVEDRLVNVEGRLINVEGRLINVEEKVDLILDDIDEMKSNIVNIKIESTMKAGKEVAENHEKRIVKLEKSALVTG